MVCAYVVVALFAQLGKNGGVGGVRIFAFPVRLVFHFVIRGEGYIDVHCLGTFDLKVGYIVRRECRCHVVAFVLVVHRHGPDLALSGDGATLYLDEQLAFKLFTVGKLATHGDAGLAFAVSDSMAGSQGYLGVQTGFGVRLGHVDQHVVRVAHKAFALMLHAGILERDASDTILQIERAGVFCGFALQIEINVQIAEWLVGTELILSGGRSVCVPVSIIG